MCQHTLAGRVSKAFIVGYSRVGQSYSVMCAYLGYVVPLPWCIEGVFGYGCAVFVLVISKGSILYFLSALLG